MIKVVECKRIINNFNLCGFTYTDAIVEIVIAKIFHQLVSKHCSNLSRYPLH
jgi:hypothetical protein